VGFAEEVESRIGLGFWCCKAGASENCLVKAIQEPLT
jgi:hypothetical protein